MCCFGMEDTLKGHIPLALGVLKFSVYAPSLELEYNILKEVRYLHFVKYECRSSNYG